MTHTVTPYSQFACACPVCSSVIHTHDQAGLTSQDQSDSFFQNGMDSANSPNTAYGNTNALQVDTNEVGWNDINGTDENGTTVITYRYGDGSRGGRYSSFNQEQRDLNETVLDNFEDTANVRFVEVGPGEHANLVFHTYDYEPRTDGRIILGSVDAFPTHVQHEQNPTINVYMNNEYFDANSTEYGGPSSTLAHEVGHAMGLSHPNGSGPAAGYDEDTTIMSYNLGQTSNWQNGFAMGPQGLDAKTLQRMYGPSLRSKGNDTYDIDGSRQVYTIVEVEADEGYEGYGDGGVDTLRVTVDQDAVIDLRQGENNVSRVGQSHIWVSGDVENAETAGGNDHVTGNALNNRITTKAGNDTVNSSDGDDTIDGGAGNDVFVMGNGEDIVTFGAGNDTATGGEGNDIYYIDRNDSGDKIITDFSSGDKLIFEEAAGEDMQDSGSIFDNISYTPDGAVITNGDGTTVTLQGVSQGDIARENIDTVAHGTDFSDVVGGDTPSSTPNNPNTPNTSDPNASDPSASSDSGPDVTAIGIASGVIGAGFVSIGVAVYKHMTALEAMKVSVVQRIRSGYEAFIQDYLRKYEPDRYRYSLTPKEYENIVNREGVESWVLKHSDIEGEYKNFTNQAKHAWRIGGALTAIGIVALVSVLTLGLGPAGLALLICGGLAAGIATGALLGAAGERIAKEQTYAFAREQIRNPENKRGITAKSVLNERQEQRRLGEKVIKSDEPATSKERSTPHSRVSHDVAEVKRSGKLEVVR